ncbi:MAG: hypothetical protein CSA83_00845, partial [Actinomycetales bacterium]
VTLLLVFEVTRGTDLGRKKVVVPILGLVAFGCVIWAGSFSDEVSMGIRMITFLALLFACGTSYLLITRFPDRS